MKFIKEENINWNEIISELTNQRITPDSFSAYHGGSMYLKNYTGSFFCRPADLEISVDIGYGKGERRKTAKKFFKKCFVLNAIAQKDQITMF